MSWLLLYPGDGDVYVMDDAGKTKAYDRGITYAETEKLTAYLEKLGTLNPQLYPGMFTISEADPRPTLIPYPPAASPSTNTSGTWLCIFRDGSAFVMENGQNKTAITSFETKQETRKLLDALKSLKGKSYAYPGKFVLATAKDTKPTVSSAVSA
jgi:hypothetical protein